MLPVANAKSVTIGWDSNDEPDLEGYVVYRNANSPGPPYSHSDTLPEDEFDDPLHPTAKLTGLQKDKEYYIALTAYNTEGVESSYSNDICVEVVNDAVELCEASAGSPVTTSSSGGGSNGGGGGSSGFACFISAASHSTSNENLLFYVLITITAISLVTVATKKVLNFAID